MGTANVTLYAQWTANPYTITFDKDDVDAVGTMANQTIASGSSASLTTNAFTKAGWQFTGWAETSGGTVAYVDGASYTMGTANVTLYAQWVCDPCSGWDATGVTVILWYAGSSGSSDPRLDIDGTIIGPACAGITEIFIEVELYNNGGTLKESFTDTLFSATGIFTVDLDVPSAFYNSITDYMLWITVPGCSTVLMILEGPVTE